eukprot:6071790-Pyramimonas_sp.AAC.1
MVGKATDWSGSRPHAMSNQGQLAQWKLTDPCLDMRIRRMRLVQSWARRPTHHLQVLGALFGELPLEHE